MNQTKNKFESLLVLHYRLCRASVKELKSIGQQIADTLQYIEKYHLFPTDLSDSFREQLALICESGSNELKLEVSKGLYLYLGKVLFSFEESNIIKMEPYTRLLELNRTEFPYEQANDWGSDVEISNVFDKDLFFFMITRKHISLSIDDYQAYYTELRKEPFDINNCFSNERALQPYLFSKIESVLQDSYKTCNDYIDRHYSLIKRAFLSYHKDVHVYVQSRNYNAYLVMINVYEGSDSGVIIYPNIVDVMYRFSNVEAFDEKLSNSILTGINNTDYSRIGSIFSISGIHHELNHLFVRYSSNKELTEYLIYMLRGQLKSVSIIRDTEIEVNKEKYLLLFSKIPTVKELLELLNKGDDKVHNVVFRSRPNDSIVEVLKSKGVSFIDVMHLGRSLINNQNGEMIHWFIKERLDKIQIDDSYKEKPLGERLIRQLEECPKGSEGWRQYETIGGNIFHYLFENTFRNYTYEYQSYTSDGTQRRDLVVNNTFKDTTSFWQLVKNDYNANIT